MNENRLQLKRVERAETNPPSPETPSRRLRSIAGARPALWAFAVIEAIALVTFLFLGRSMWFWFDEWELLAGRGLNAHDILRAHGGHLVAVPVVAYRVLFYFFGLRTYLPYGLFAILLHLTAAALLRVHMRRADVHPWLATAAASLFVFFGAGGEDILWGFQIAFSGALVFGLIQLLLADHDGGIDHRDWLGLAAGLAALACSGVGVAMVAVVGIAAFIRRGWRAAAFHTLPLVAIFYAWSTQYETKQTIVNYPILLARWVWRGLTSTFDGFGQVRFVGWILLLMLVVGLVVAWWSWDPTARRRRAAVPVALLVGAVGFIALSGLTRAWGGPQAAASSRYLHIVGGLLLVPLAIAGDALRRRYRVLAPVVFVLFLIGIPANIAVTRDHFPSAAYYESYRLMMLSLPRMKLAGSVPGSLRPEPQFAPDVTIGWLRAGVRSGRLPKPRALTPTEYSTNTLRLSLQQLNETDGRECAPLEDKKVVRLRPGQSLVVRGTVTVELLRHGNRPASLPVPFGASLQAGNFDHTLLAVAHPLALRVAPAFYGAAVCGP